MFKLAHISDPHLGPLPDPTAWQLASKRVFGYVNWRRNRKGALTSNVLDRLVEDLWTQDPDHLAITGDLVNLALPAEIANARRWLNELGAARDISIILGNHDAYVPNSRFKAEEAWKPYLQGDETDPDLQHAPSSFPFLRIRDTVALIGVNSAKATMPLMATGYFRKAQAKKLAAILDETRAQGLFRVVMIHHPPNKNATHWHKRLIGASLFRHILQSHGAELVLHGHTHLDTKQSLPGPQGSIPVICVPSASQGFGSHKPPARYNLFEIDRQQGNWRCSLTERGYAPESHKIEQIAQQDLIIP
ncbi:metallophosphoesterase [uncultured Cohaesibacter sp.]|uniref:metallophosphoesterase family protein n=1 Tax=uncultured Cohaesibacter sp. TaxID=1002546 RepID=UPI002931BEAC|nr:metallophosphoesterase [uncultured Cohaesibacter sp.]